MIHISIRSINTNFDQLIIYLQSLVTKFNVIILSEYWLINNFRSQVIKCFTLKIN